MREGRLLKQEMFYCPPPVCHPDVNSSERTSSHQHGVQWARPPWKYTTQILWETSCSEAILLWGDSGAIYCKHGSGKATIVADVHYFINMTELNAMSCHRPQTELRSDHLTCDVTRCMHQAPPAARTLNVTENAPNLKRLN